jgi:hypothetical protein
MCIGGLSYRVLDNDSAPPLKIIAITAISGSVSKLSVEVKQLRLSSTKIENAVCRHSGRDYSMWNYRQNAQVIISQVVTHEKSPIF